MPLMWLRRFISLVHRMNERMNERKNQERKRARRERKLTENQVLLAVFVELESRRQRENRRSRGKK